MCILNSAHWGNNPALPKQANTMQNVNVSFSRVSGNVKTGPIPVTTTGAQSCPNVCPLKGSGCYAEVGPISWHWKKTTNGTNSATSHSEAMKKVKALPKGTFWRANAAGDLLHNSEIIDVPALMLMIDANRNKRGFTYTHHDMNKPQNRESVKNANAAGFTINLSANNLEHADELTALNIGPVVTIMPLDCEKITRTPAGNTVIQCPATYMENMNCQLCGVCQVQYRKAIIGFPVHGVRKAAAHKVFMMKAA